MTVWTTKQTYAALNRVTKVLISEQFFVTDREGIKSALRDSNASLIQKEVGAPALPDDVEVLVGSLGGCWQIPLAARWLPRVSLARLPDGHLLHIRDAPWGILTLAEREDVRSLYASNIYEPNWVVTSRVTYWMTGWDDSERCWVYTRQ